MSEQTENFETRAKNWFNSAKSYFMEKVRGFNDMSLFNKLVLVAFIHYFLRLLVKKREISS